MSDCQYVIIVSGNGLNPIRWQTIIWTSYCICYAYLHRSASKSYENQPKISTNKEDYEKIYAGHLTFSIQGTYCSSTQGKYHGCCWSSAMDWTDCATEPLAEPNRHGIYTIWVLVIWGKERKWSGHQLFRYKMTIPRLPLISSHGIDSVRYVGIPVKLIWIFLEPHWLVLTANGAPRNIQGNLTGMGGYLRSMRKWSPLPLVFRVNSLTTGRCNSIIKYVIFKNFLVSGIWTSLCEITLN